MECLREKYKGRLTLFFIHMQTNMAPALMMSQITPQPKSVMPLAPEKSSPSKTINEASSQAINNRL